jgi:hypothetical protein
LFESKATPGIEKDCAIKFGIDNPALLIDLNSERIKNGFSTVKQDLYDIGIDS